MEALLDNIQDQEMRQISGQKKKCHSQNKSVMDKPPEMVTVHFHERVNNSLRHGGRVFLQNDKNGLCFSHLTALELHSLVGTGKTQTSSIVALTSSTVVCSLVASVFRVYSSVLPEDSSCSHRASRSPST